MTAEHESETPDAEVDRLFAELVAGYGRTAGAGDRVHPAHADPVVPDRPPGELPFRRGEARPAELTDPPSTDLPTTWPTRGLGDWAANHPLLARPDQTPDPSTSDASRLDAFRTDSAPDTSTSEPSVAERASVEPATRAWRPPARADATAAGRDEEPYERYRPELRPLGRPRWPVLVGWGGMLFAVVATLLAIFGVPVPGWVGWLSVAGFLGGFGLLVAQLPRHRPPDAGDGAVL